MFQIWFDDGRWEKEKLNKVELAGETSSVVINPGNKKVGIRRWLN